MDEDINVMSYAAPSQAAPNTGKWTVTSTYDIYMVDTPKKDGDGPDEEPPKCRRQRKRSKGQGKGRESNTDTNGTGHNDTPDNMEELGNNTTPEQHRNASERHEDQGNPEDPGDSEDINYLPPSKEEDSLRPEDFVVPEDPLDQERFKQQLIATARILKKKQQQLKAEQDTLNDRWTTVLAA